MSGPFGQRKSDELINDPFSAYDGTGGTTVVGTAVTVPLTLEHVVSSANYSLANNELTLNKTDRFEITFSITATVTTNARTQGQGWLERWNGTTWSEVPGTRVWLYCRRTNHGATGSRQIFYDLASGNRLRLRIQRTAGGGTLSLAANGSALAVRTL